MKKITMLLAAVGVAMSSMAFSAEQLVKVDDIYAKMANGTERSFDVLDEACDALAKQPEYNPFGDVEYAKFSNFHTGRDGDNERKLVCSVKRARNGAEVRVGPYGPAFCKKGGLYMPFFHGCFEYQEVNN